MLSRSAAKPPAPPPRARASSNSSAFLPPFLQCHQVLASLSVWGNNVRHWLHYGCYKAESYGAMEIIRPCPSHIICR